MVSADLRTPQPSQPHDFPSSLPFAPGARKEENVRSLINDKRAVAAQRQRYEQYSVVVEEVGAQAGPLLGRNTRLARVPSDPCFRSSQVPLQPGDYHGDDYEDEYDDTYDGNQVGANDADSDDELISRR